MNLTRWSILFAAGLAGLAAAAVYVRWFSPAPLYESTTVLRQVDMLPAGKSQLPSPLSQINTTAVHALSRDSLKRMIRSHKIYEEELLVAPMEDVIESMRKQVRMRPESGATLVASFRYPDPKMAQQVCGALANSLIEELRAARVELARNQVMSTDGPPTEAPPRPAKLRPAPARLALEKELDRQDRIQTQEELDSAKLLFELALRGEAGGFEVLDAASLPTHPVDTQVPLLATATFAAMGIAGLAMLLAPHWKVALALAAAATAGALALWQFNEATELIQDLPFPCTSRAVVAGNPALGLSAALVMMSRANLLNTVATYGLYGQLPPEAAVERLRQHLKIEAGSNSLTVTFRHYGSRIDAQKVTHHAASGIITHTQRAIVESDTTTLRFLRAEIDETAEAWDRNPGLSRVDEDLVKARYTALRARLREARRNQERHQRQDAMPIQLLDGVSMPELPHPAIVPSVGAALGLALAGLVIVKLRRRARGPASASPPDGTEGCSPHESPTDTLPSQS